jgi:hypothetical protein
MLLRNSEFQLTKRVCDVSNNMRRGTIFSLWELDWMLRKAWFLAHSVGLWLPFCTSISSLSLCLCFEIAIFGSLAQWWIWNFNCSILLPLDLFLKLHVVRWPVSDFDRTVCIFI